MSDQVLHPTSDHDVSTKEQAHSWTESVYLRKAFVGALGFLLMAATVRPIAQNWKKTPHDSFPFSYYPMFSEHRGHSYSANYIVGLDARGERQLIPYLYAGQGGFNQTRRQINRLIREGKADRLCRAVETAVELQGGSKLRDVATIEIVTGRFRFDDYFAGNKTPSKERVRASCGVSKNPSNTDQSNPEANDDSDAQDSR